jgi:hypothetical protein
MNPPLLKMGGNEFGIHQLQLGSELDRGTMASLHTGERVANLRRGAPAMVLAAGNEFDLVVQEFRMPLTRGGGFLRLVDPVLAAKPYRDEAFSAASGETGFDRAVSARVSAGGKGKLPELKHPAIVLDGITLVDLLRDICANQPGWHFRWNGGKVEIGPLPQDVHKLHGGRAEETHAGREVVLIGNAPSVGDAAQHGDLTGVVLSSWITYELGGSSENRVCIGQAQIPDHAPWEQKAWLRATVEQPEPLFIKVQLPAGRTASVRARLFSFQADSGRCRIAVPVVAGDKVLAAWPTGVFTGEVIAIPFGDVPAAAQLVIKAEKSKVQFAQWDVGSTKIDIQVSEEMHIHR